ncbi:hypothetical protein [Microcella humidisoli]|uniref:Integral membrane protein n=1 Tax=Microcella humidisoli TaxID=2963406 RepID=A0ABY5FXY8_9MICO|nr:hypothetical protein [Microcella humidisoli]UTT63149.1 hypothetical protein NNL39_03285 [Microcella humidisoli]
MRAFRIALLIVTAIALVVNAVIHFQLAGPFEAITGTLVGQGTLFRIQAAVNIAAALLLITRTRWAAALAALVAAGGLALVVITTLVPLDLSPIGLPVLFEPIWYADKVIAAVAQAIALAAAITAALLRPRPAGPVQP